MNVAVVTGAAAGIGQAISKCLAAKGFAVAVLDINPKVADTAQDIKDNGGQALAITIDISKKAQWVTAFDQIEKELGPAVALVNNAGIEGTYAPINNYPEDIFRQVIEVNVLGTFLGLQIGLERMRAYGKGSVVNIASTSAIRGRAGLSAYVASKHAVLGLTRSAALDMAEYGIRVNAVLPGPVDTRMIHAIDASAAEFNHAVERNGPTTYIPPESVAKTVMFLLSDEASHVNGSHWVVDAGSTIR